MSVGNVDDGVSRRRHVVIVGGLVIALLALNFVVALMCRAVDESWEQNTSGGISSVARTVLVSSAAAFDWLMLGFLIEYSELGPIYALMLASAFGFVGLFSVWGAVSRRNMIQRAAGVGSGIAMVPWPVGFAFPGTDDLNLRTTIFILSLFLLVEVVAVLRLLRLCGLELVGRQGAGDRPSFQFSLRDVLLLMTVIATFLAIQREVRFVEVGGIFADTGLAYWGEMLILVSGLAVLTLASAWAILGRGWLLVRVALLLSCSLITAAGVESISSANWDSAQFVLYVVWFGFYTAILAASLAVFRRLGYRFAWQPRGAIVQ